MDVRALTVIFNVRSWKMHKNRQTKLLVPRIKPGTYVNQYVQSYMCTKFGDFILKNESRNAKTAWLIK